MPLICLYIFYGLLAYMPLHIFLSTIIGANLGGLGFFKIFKDIVAAAGFVMLLLYSLRQTWFKSWIKNYVVLLIIAYAVLTLGLALVKPTDQQAEILGVVYNLRFLMFFLYGWLLVYYFPAKAIGQTAIKLVLAVSLPVVIFGLVQYFVLPNNALTHLGFTRANGVLPAFFIDDKPNLERVMSTLRDPNSLGSYLIIIMALIATKFNKKKIKKVSVGWLLFTAASFVCLLLTFSRSALIGLVVAALVYGGLQFKDKLNPAQLKRLIIATGAALVIIIAGFVAARNTYFVKNAVFHADQSTVQKDPNQLRVQFTKDSINRIIHHPIGNGPGTAGLASIKNKIQGTELTEDYYLQIGSEVGVVGLALFVAIIAAVAFRLYFVSQDKYAAALLAALAGLVVTNLLVHIWSNEAVAYTWWGLAAIFGYNSKTINTRRAWAKKHLLLGLPGKTVGI